MGGTFELDCCTITLLSEIRCSGSRGQVAKTYALALKSSNPTDWKQVNAAIIERWSHSALEYIKTQAWKIVDSQKAGKQ